MKKDPEISTGAIESPKDYRDEFVANAVAVTPAPESIASFYYNMNQFPHLMQAKEPACVNHWLADAMKLHWFKKTGKVINFSPRFGDVLCKKYDGQPIDGGTYPRLALKLAAQFGMATEATVSNDTSLPLGQYRDQSILTPEAYAEAAQYKIPGYIQVPLNEKSMKDYIYSFGFVGTNRNIGSEWWTPSWNDKDIDPLKTPKNVVSGHMTGDFGWSGNLMRLRNEWSNAWANGGNADYDIVQWLPYIKEAWVIAEVPSDLKTFLSDLPSPSNFHYQWSTDMKQGTGPTDDIKMLQIAMMILGYMTPPPVDQLGYYGPRTAQAVLAYQEALEIPGALELKGSISGPKTRDSLNKRFSL
ncbi:MAG: peptidoglycan-binding domain-containing protein [Patescibacteria group bacterium]